jgi:hypothetical protein
MSPQSIRDALPAEPVGEGPILQWTENMPPSEGCRYDHCIAETPFGRFRISWKGWKQFDSPTVDETPWGDWDNAFNSVDEAKAACQKEMDERLARWSRPATLLQQLSAPVPVVVPVAVEALTRLYWWGGMSGSYGYSADVVLGVRDWIYGGMVGSLPPLPAWVADRCPPLLQGGEVEA